MNNSTVSDIKVKQVIEVKDQFVIVVDKEMIKHLGISEGDLMSERLTDGGILLTPIIDEEEHKLQVPGTNQQPVAANFCLITNGPKEAESDGQ